MLLRLCATVQPWAIALTYEIEASGSRLRGGFMVLVFVLVVVFVGLGCWLCECKISSVE